MAQRGSILAQSTKVYRSSGSETPERTYSPASLHRNRHPRHGWRPPTRITSRPAMSSGRPHHEDGDARFTRLTNGFSKKVENLAHAVSLNYMHYNFCRTHQLLTKRYGKPTTPAMAAGIAQYAWS